jgi:hypothetical protein
LLDTRYDLVLETNVENNERIDVHILKPDIIIIIIIIIINSILTISEQKFKKFETGKAL